MSGGSRSTRMPSCVCERRARKVPRSESVYARFSEAIVRVWPIAVAASTYHAPAGWTPARRHNAFSKMSVPEPSPREMNGARTRAISRSASTVLRPFVCAGSSGGPTSTKSLCMTKMRRAPFGCCGGALWPPPPRRRRPAPGDLDDAVGRLHPARRGVADLEADLRRGLRGHERDEGVRSGEDLHHRRDAVALDAGDDPLEA